MEHNTPCAELLTLRGEVKELTSDVAKLYIANAATGERLNNIDKTLERMEESLKNVNEKLTSLLQRPAKKWDGMVDTISKWVVTAVLAYLAFKIGLA